VSQAATGEGREEAERAETTGFGIQPVRPVVVEIRVGRDSAAPSPGGPTVTSSASAYPAQEGPPSTAEPAAAASAPQTPPAATRELAAAMSRWLQQEWGLRPSAIRIAFAAERSAR
jgi:hypothetical protein